MRTVKNSPNFTQLNYQGYEVRCLVTPNSTTATISLVKKLDNEPQWRKIDTTNLDDDIVKIWMRKVTGGLKIQFNRQGNWYDLLDSFTIADCNIQLPDNNNVPFPDTTNSAVEFNVTQRPVPMLNSITVLPRGTIVDLKYSEHEGDMRNNVNGERDTQQVVEFAVDDTDSSSPQLPDYMPRSVIVMFSPAGYVSRFYVDGLQNVDDESKEILPFRGVFYFLVGEWDRINSGEDGRDNLATPSNFWVTIKDRDGSVRISPNAETNNLNDARRHACEDLYKNIGGQ
jgi:hypothetical protein